MLSEREEGRERNIDAREKHLLVPPVCAQTGDRTHSEPPLNCNLGMCPEWESNLQPFGYGTMVHPAEPHSSELVCLFFEWKEKERERKMM